MTRPGRYEIGLHVQKTAAPGVAHLKIQTQDLKLLLSAGAEGVVFRNVALTPGPAQLQVWLERDNRPAGILDARVTWIGKE